MTSSFKFISVRPLSDTSFSHTILRYCDKRKRYCNEKIKRHFSFNFVSPCVNWNFLGGKDVRILKCTNNILIIKVFFWSKYCAQKWLVWRTSWDHQICYNITIFFHFNILTLDTNHLKPNYLFVVHKCYILLNDRVVKFYLHFTEKMT